MSLPRLTVAIPTRDRSQRLAETLTALAAQEVDGAFEVVVVDDGSSGETVELLKTWSRGPFELRWERQEPSGPAVARNRAVRLARAERLLFLGDDTRPAPGALAAHLAAAEGRGVAVQGHIDWDPEAPITPVMRFLAPEGPQFYFKGLLDGEPIPYTAVLGSNFSAPTAWLREDPYDEGFPAAALEDTELAYRLERKSRRTIYARRALCWHHHHYAALDPFLARQRRAGRAARYAVARQPPLLWRVVLQPLAMSGWMLGRHAARRVLGRRRDEDVWDLASRRAFFHGFFSSRRSQGP